MTAITWQPQRDGSFWGYSGHLVVGMVLKRYDGKIVYDVCGVRMKWIGKGFGEVKSFAQGKRSVERAWQQWLEHAGLSLSTPPTASER